MSRRAGRYGWVVAVLAACNFLNYAQRNVLFSAYDDLRARFATSDATLGLLGSVYMAAHALATLPSGWLGDRADRRRLLAAAALVWSAGAGLAALAPDVVTLGVGRAMTGLATAVVVPVSNAILSEVVPNERKASVLAVFNLGLFLGGVAGFGIGANLAFPWSLVALAVPGVAIALATARLDVPARSRGADRTPGLRELARHLRRLAAIPTLRWVMLSTTLMAFAAGGLLAWLKDFLQHHKHLSENGATAVLGVSMIGGLAGVVTGGRVADRLRARLAHGRLITISAGMASTVPCGLVCIFAPNLPVLVVGSIATMFFVSWYHGPMAATVDDLAPDGTAVTTQALVIFSMHLLGTAPASWVIGAIKDAHGFTIAMLVPTVMIGAASLAMTRGFATFAGDVRSTPPGRSAMTAVDG